MYMAGTALGCVLLGVSPEGLEAIDWELHGRGVLRATLWRRLRPYLWPFVVGNTVLGRRCGGRWRYFVLRRSSSARRRGAAASA